MNPNLVGLFIFVILVTVYGKAWKYLRTNSFFIFSWSPCEPSTSSLWHRWFPFFWASNARYRSSSGQGRRQRRSQTSRSHQTRYRHSSRHWRPSHSPISRSHQDLYSWMHRCPLHRCLQGKFWLICFVIIQSFSVRKYSCGWFILYFSFAITKSKILF